MPRSSMATSAQKVASAVSALLARCQEDGSAAQSVRSADIGSMLSNVSVVVAVRIMRAAYRDEIRDVAGKTAAVQLREVAREVDRVLAHGEGLHDQVVPRVDARIQREARG